MNRGATWSLVGALSLLSSRALALDLGNPSELASVEIHGFVSQGFILTKDNNYLSESTKGSFRFTEVGINFTKPLVDRLRLGIQLFAHDVGPRGNFEAKMDWFYLDYRFRDWLGLRAGRVKVPFGLYNEINDVDAARVPVLLPQSVYPVQNRDYLLAQTGGELYGYARVGAAGALDYRLYGGTIFLDATPQPGSPITVLELEVPYLFGGRLLWETPLDGLRAGGSVQALRLDTKLLRGADVAEVGIPAVLWIASMEYAAHDLLVAAEYSRWHLKVESTDTRVFPNSKTVSERAYAMASYRMASWFQPGVYYSLLFPDVEKRTGRENVQHDAALTLRYDINSHWLFKLEGHYMEGTAALSPTLNDNTPLSELSRSWGVFLVKTTAHF
jgi:hypothetical protein